MFVWIICGISLWYGHYDNVHADTTQAELRSIPSSIKDNEPFIPGSIGRRDLESVHKSLTLTQSIGIFDGGGKNEKGFIVYRDGNIDFVGDTQMPDAIRAFWRTVALAYPDFCKNRAESQGAKNAK